MSSPSILIIGASGYIGTPLCREFLHQKSHFSRLAILTEDSKKEKFAKFHEQGFELVLGSFISPSSFKGFDTVICLLGNHGMKYQPAIIDAAVAGGIREFYPSEYGSDFGQGPYPTNRYFRDKLITREHLRDTVAKVPGFNFTLIMVGGLAEFVVEPLFGADTVNHTFTFYGLPEKQEPLTSVPDVARYIVESLLLPRHTSGERAFRVPGGLYAWKDIIKTISKLQGVKYKARFLPNEYAISAATECAKKGDADGELTYSLKAIMGDPAATAVPRPWDNEKFSFKPESFEKVMKRFFAKKG